MIMILGEVGIVRMWMRLRMWMRGEDLREIGVWVLVWVWMSWRLRRRESLSSLFQEGCQTSKLIRGTNEFYVRKGS